jgi:hypothetical protein
MEWTVHRLNRMELTVKKCNAPCRSKGRATFVCRSCVAVGGTASSRYGNVGTQSEN